MARHILKHKREHPKEKTQTLIRNSITDKIMF